ncbi:hypothetical protein D3C80_1916430 [compost metagenome]
MNVQSMAKSKSWGSEVEIDSNGVLVVKNLRAVYILRRYIQIGNSQQKMINKVRSYFYQVDSFTRTGLTFTDTISRFDCLLSVPAKKDLSAIRSLLTK